MKVLVLALTLLSLKAFAAQSGSAAPAISLASASGKTVSLADYKGKVVVLEWLNHGCPFVRKHYDSGNMQALQKKYSAQGVVWLSIISSAEGKQGYVTASGALEDAKKNGSAASEILLDPQGVAGRAYEAKTTPHMYVIDPQGDLVYQGAIDDKATANKDDVVGAKNYVAQALDATLRGEKVALASTKAYGCAVKYK